MSSEIVSINRNEIRIGRFTSSQVYRLMGTPAPRAKYIKEKLIEKRLGRPLKLDKYSRPAAWGLLLEQYVCGEKLGTGYQSVGDITLQHPEYGEVWAGSPDAKNIREKVASSIKCYEPENFATFVDALNEAAKSGTDYLRDERPEEYWQALSDACLLGMDFIEFIVYMPYFSELDTIRAYAEAYDGLDQWKYKFIATSDYTEVAWLPDKGYYKSLNIFRFPVNEADKALLTQKILEASKLLQPFS